MNTIKTLLAMAIIALTSYSSWAQRTPAEQPLFRRIKLPTNPLPAEYTTYEVNTDYDEIPAAYSVEIADEVRKALVLEGYTEVAPGQGDLIITLNMGPGGVSSPQSEVSESTKKVDGKSVTVKTYAYTVKATLFINFRMTVRSTGEELYLESNSYGKELVTSYFSSSAARSEYWKKNGAGFSKKAMMALVESFLSYHTTTMKNQYAYQVVFDRCRIQTAKKRKMDYSELDAAQEMVVAAFKALEEEPPMQLNENEAFVATMEDALAIWRTEVDQYEDSRKARINGKVAEAIYENIYSVLFYLDRLEEAEAVLQEMGEVLGSDGERLAGNLRNSKPIKSRREKLIASPFIEYSTEG